MKRFDVIRSMLMLVGLAAAPSAFAVGNPQVYDVRFVLRTTVAQSDTLNNFDNAFLENADKEYVAYRELQTITWHGLIWGSGCNAIDGVWEETGEVLGSDFPAVKGCVIWDTKTKKPVYFGNGSNLGDLDTVPGTGFGWDFIQAIEKNGQKCEGAWTMQQDGDICEDTEWEEVGAELFHFKGAGFGTLAFALQAGKLSDASHVDSIAGDLTGYMKAPYKIKDTDWSGCTFCGYAPIAGSCDPAEAWNYCDCIDLLDESKTAAYGTWVIKYNPLYSYQYGKAMSILDTDCFADLPLVAAAILAIEYAILDYDPTGCDELAHALALAKQNTYAKEQAVEAVKYENLKAAEVKAAAELAKAEKELQAAQAAGTGVMAAQKRVAIAMDALTSAQNNLANINLLQYKAAQDLEKAEAAEALAQKAYDDAGCDLLD